MDCKKIRAGFIDYMDGSLKDEERRLIDGHLENCKDCREELIAMKVMVNDINISNNDINIPSDFMDNIKNRVNKTIALRKKKKPLRVILIAAAILVMSAVTVFASQGELLDFIKSLNPKNRISNLVDKGVGNRLNISKVDKNIKITVTDVAADDIQTLISFKIEDLKDGKSYHASYTDGINIKERWGRAGEETGIDMYTSLFNVEGENTLTLYPIDTKEKTIHLSFNKLQLDSGEAKEYVEGNWEFEIPIKKYEGKSYEIHESIKLDKYTVYFRKINISPTLTTLHFDHDNVSSDEEMLGLEDVRIIANGKEYKPYNFGHGSWDSYSTVGYGSSEMTFDSMFFDNPKNIEIKIGRISTKAIEDEPKEFVINLDETSPQEFEYLGTKMYIDNLKIGDNITFDLSQSIDNRKYEVLDNKFQSVEGWGGKKYFAGASNFAEAYYVDKDNIKYECFDALSKWDKIRNKKPVFYVSKTNHKLKPSDGWDIKKEKAIKMLIEGYTKTKFVDGTVKIKLK